MYDAVLAGGISPLWMGAASIISWAIIAYSAIGPGAVADVMQSRAQERVKASQANVILSAEPLMAALLGVLILGETLPLAAAGANDAPVRSVRLYVPPVRSVRLYVSAFFLARLGATVGQASLKALRGCAERTQASC